MGRIIRFAALLFLAFLRTAGAFHVGRTEPGSLDVMRAFHQSQVQLVAQSSQLPEERKTSSLLPVVFKTPPSSEARALFNRDNDAVLILSVTLILLVLLIRGNFANS